MRQQHQSEKPWSHWIRTTTSVTRDPGKPIMRPEVPYEEEQPRVPVTCDSCLNRYHACIDYKYEP
jgi:hypothetical protein